MSKNLVLIGGGNTRFMLAEWEKVNLKEYLK